jgi:hypothetical protein
LEESLVEKMKISPPSRRKASLVSMLDEKYEEVVPFQGGHLL